MISKTAEAADSYCTLSSEVYVIPSRQRVCSLAGSLTRCTGIGRGRHWWTSFGSMGTYLMVRLGGFRGRSRCLDKNIGKTADIFNELLNLQYQIVRMSHVPPRILTLCRHKRWTESSAPRSARA